MAPESDMAQLTVRNVDDEIAAALKARAAKSGRSAEAEHRRILQEALMPRPRGDFFERAPARRVKLSEGRATTTDILREDRDRAGA
jgi:plasmid stability protein